MKISLQKIFVKKRSSEATFENIIPPCIYLSCFEAAKPKKTKTEEEDKDDVILMDVEDSNSTDKKDKKSKEKSPVKSKSPSPKPKAKTSGLVYFCTILYYAFLKGSVYGFGKKW